MIQKAGIADFLDLAKKYPVLDVRSPGEYVRAHLPGAYSLPLFNDEERKIVGTAYKQESREQAIKLGLDFYGVKMRKMVEETEAIVAAHPGSAEGSKTILVHCWRGGMRSAGVAWLLDLYGFKVYTLNGGYKAFRNWVLQQFEKDYPFAILGGYTGSGKTDVLKEMAELGHTVVDLEQIANHKGSAFGGLGGIRQPTQEMFDNELAIKLSSVSQSLRDDERIWLEDESQRIGLVNLPNALWNTMRKAPVYFLEIPFEERLDYITETYSKYTKEELVNAVIRIQKRLGGLAVKNTIGFLVEDNYKEAFRILLRYYDKYYSRALNERANLHRLLMTIPAAHVDAKTNSKMVADKKITNGISN